MKKQFIFLFIGILLMLTSCIYIGLFPNELKKHNSKIQEQITDFPFECYSGEFYYFPNEEKKVHFKYSDGNLELLIIEENSIYYNNNEIGLCYNFLTDEETTFEKNVEEYSYYRDIIELIEIIKSYENYSKKTAGIRGSGKDDEGILDEVTHYFYDMEWEYLDSAMLIFYVNKDSSKLKRIYFTDCTNNYSLDKRHFIMNAYLDAKYEDYTLKDTYYQNIEEYKNYKQEEENKKNEDKIK